MPAKKKPGKKAGRKKAPRPPATHRTFIRTYPDLGKAWELIGKAGRSGPLDARAVRLVKLAVAMGAMREGAVHSNVRKALAEGLTKQEIKQAVALAAGTLGLPSTAAVFTWVRDVTGG
jgi:alkylhydroperoxidase/carboxymuconolactone decarboxylase family protein YurZ